jgi:hypothetical protein
MPEVTIGFSGSKGMPFLLQVICGAAERRFRGLAGQPSSAQVDQHQMGVGAAGDDVEAAFAQRFGQRLGIGDDLARRS